MPRTLSKRRKQISAGRRLANSRRTLRAGRKKPSRLAVRRGPLAMAEARRRLSTLPEQLAKRRGIRAVKITRRGKPVLAVMSWDAYESVVETLGIMSDPEMMAAFHQGVRDMEEGRVHPWEQVKKELDL